jgi:hypothetical protein
MAKITGVIPAMRRWQLQALCQQHIAAFYRARL